MRATFRVATCLLNQERRIIKNKFSIGGDRTYSICEGCQTGQMAKKGLLNDNDVEELIKKVTEENILQRISKDNSVRKEDSMEENQKKCSKCKQLKDKTEFYKDKGALDGLRSSCKACDMARTKMKESQKEIKEDIKEPIEPLVAPPDDLSKPSYVVSIDFSNSTDLYNRLKQIAIEEERTLEGQIRYILKKCLSH